MCGTDPYRASAKNTFFLMFFFTPRSANAKSLQKHVSIFVQDRVFSRYLCVFGENSSFLLSSREGNQDIELERETSARTGSLRVARPRRNRMSSIKEPGPLARPRRLWGGL